MKNIAWLMPWIRIGMGLLGAHLVTRGMLTAEMNDSLQNDPLIMEAILTAIGAALVALQVIWWKVAQMMEWKT